MSTANDLQAKFEAYHNAHPGIWELFKKKALELIANNVTHYGAKSIMEVLRYHTAIDSRPGSRFKIDNSFSAYYARKFADEFPQHSGFFELRVIKSKAA